MSGAHDDFEVAALFNALDAQRRAHELSWHDVASQISAQSAGWHARTGVLTDRDPPSR
jgi:hypothetical protein